MKKYICTLLMLLVLSFSSTAVLSYAIPITADAAAMKISKKKVSLEKGEKYQLKITGAKKVSWKSNKPSIAKVNGKGIVTAKKAGKAKITATVSGKKFVCTVTVTVKAPKKTGKEALKDEIVKNGGTQPDGTKSVAATIKYEDTITTHRIHYDSGRDIFIFKQLFENEDGTKSELTMEIPNREIATTMVNINYVVKPSAEFSANATVDIAACSENTAPAFTITNMIGIDASKTDTALEIAKSFFNMAMGQWNAILKDRLGMTMRDIGFSSYN